MSNSVKLEVWPLVKNHATEWWVLFGLTWVPIFAWFTPVALPALLFIWGVPFLVCLPRIKAFAPAAIATAAILIMAFLRSDFVAYLGAGRGLAAAFATKYWFAPIFIWFVAWAVICGFSALRGDGASRAAAWFGWLIVGLAVVQLLESISGMVLRTALNNAFYHGARPQLLIVDMSDCNTIMTMLFWPMALYYMDRRKFLPLCILVIAIVAGAIASDNNAQLLAMAGSTAVFFAARFWPRSLDGLPPWRVAAVFAATLIGVFPIIIYGLVATGTAQKVKTDMLPSWAARIDIWSFAVQRALEKPWFGWGYEASRQWDPIIPNHPHNMSLQAWLELGVPGLLLLAGLWFVIFWWLGPRDAFNETGEPELRELGAPGPAADAQPSVLQRAMPYILAVGTAFYIVNTISYGLWRSEYYCIGAVVVGVTILVMNSADAHMKLRSQP